MPDRFEIVHDPEGIFTPGTRFNETNFNSTLAASAWIREMIILDITTGIRYRVTQCLVPIDPNLPPLIPNIGRTTHVIPGLKTAEEIAQ